ncbi:MAG: nucleotidyltransferase domain-containing protein [Candidatus Bathyarchaeota archaeon]|nr:nucleotidyltransferase domain-containing protein [Candidatus Bathyarchaeota archaeon]
MEALSKAAKELEEVYGEEFLGLALFGSWPRGEAKPDSDVDVFVVLNSLSGFEVRSKIYGVIATKVGRSVTLINARLDDLSREGLEVTSLLLNILYDAIVVYDRLGVLKRLAEDVRRLIEKANLIRYRTPDGKYGWKRIDDKALEAVEV